MNSTQAFYRLAYNKEPSDCSVRALAVTCAVPYRVAHAAMHFCGRGPEGAASIDMMINAACSLGFAARHVYVNALTVRALCGELENEPGAYLAFTCNHVVGFWQGECIDWSRDTLARIIKVYAIVKEKRT